MIVALILAAGALLVLGAACLWYVVWDTMRDHQLERARNVVWAARPIATWRSFDIKHENALKRLRGALDEWDNGKRGTP